MVAAVLEMIDQDAWDDAYRVLLEMERKAPNDELVLSLLNRSASAIGDYPAAERAALKLRRLSPRSLDALQMLTEAHIANDRPALTLSVLEDILQRFPGNDTPGPEAIIDKVRHTVTELLLALGYRYPENIDLLLLHEESQMLLGQGDYAAAGRIMRTLRLRYPAFLPVVNNMALVLAAEAEYEKAIVAAKEALDLEPDNIHALANLITFHCMLGRREEAASYVDRIKASKAMASLRRQKMAEALSHFGDHEAVLSLQKQEPGPDETPEITAKVLHYAAAAACHVDRRTTARRFWRQALELTPQEHPLRAESGGPGSAGRRTPRPRPLYRSAAHSRNRLDRPDACGTRGGDGHAGSGSRDLSETRPYVSESRPLHAGGVRQLR